MLNASYDVLCAEAEVSLTFALQGQFTGCEGLNPSACNARFRKIAE